MDLDKNSDVVRLSVSRYKGKTLNWSGLVSTLMRKFEMQNCLKEKILWVIEIKVKF